MQNSKNKRLPPNAGKGRPKGASNKNTKLLKDAILIAGENAGNKMGGDGLVSYLEAQAIDNPAAFMALLGKVLPTQLTGDGGGAIETITKIEIVAPLIEQAE